MKSRIVLAVSFLFASLVRAEPPSPELVTSLLDAVGGEAKLLRVFRIKESLVLGKREPISRESILAPPEHWWVGKRDRAAVEKEPAAFLVWAWTLAPLRDAKSQLELVADAKLDDKPAIGIRVSGRTDKPMLLLFDATTKRLARIDWRDDSNRFSDWRQLDGLWYAAKCAGFKPDGREWYSTELVEMERLAEIPTYLKPKQ